MPQVDRGTVVDEFSGAPTSSEWELATMGANLSGGAQARLSRGRAARTDTVLISRGVAQGLAHSICNFVVRV